MLVKRFATLLALVVGLQAVGCLDDGEGDLDLNSVTQDIGPGPTNLTATVISSTSVQLSWNAVTGATDYVIQRSNTPGTETNYTSNSPPTATTFRDSHLTANTQYCYVVRAFVPGPGLSDPSNEQCVTTSTGPQPPANVTATATSSSSITVTWAAVTGATHYYVYMSTGGGAFNNIGFTTPPTTTFVASGLQPATTYTFEIKTEVVNTLSAFSAPASATTYALGLEGYYKYDDRSGTSAADASGFGRTGTLAGGAAFSATNESPVRDSQDHNPSNLLVPTSAGAVSSAVPNNFISDATIEFWVYLPAAPSGDIRFAGRRAAGCGTQTWAIGVDTTGIYFSGAAAAKNYFGQTLATATWTHLAVTQHGGTINMYVNGAPATMATSSYTSGPSVSAQFQVGNIGGCANAGAAQIDELRIYSRQLTATEIATFGARPPAVSTLATTKIDSTYILLGWSAPTGGADKYYMWKGTAPGNETLLTSVGTTTFRSDHLTVSTQYSYQVYAQKNGLVGPASNEIVATTLAPPPAPTNVAGVISTCCTPKRVNLSWTAEPRAILYLVYQSDNGGAFSRIGSPTGTTFQTGNLTSGHTYMWYVQSEDDAFIVSTTNSNTVTIMIP